MVSSNIHQHAIMNHDPLSKASAAQEIALKAAEPDVWLQKSVSHPVPQFWI
jgi:alpha-D-ribose 1-methylphosphonate 5-triphosphate synthase subunit PhnH